MNKKPYIKPEAETARICLQKIMQQVVISTSYTSAEGESGANNTAMWEEEDGEQNPWGLWEPSDNW